MAFSFTRSAKFFLPFSVLLVLASLALLVYPSPKMSIEFTGGTLMELHLPQGKTKADLETAMAAFKRSAGTGAVAATAQPLQSVSIAETREKSYFVRTETLSNEDHLALLAHLKTSVGEVRETQYNTIGPTVGSSLKRRAFFALGVATIAIVLYIALAFRKIPRALSPWRFGIVAIVALLHDILITVGIFTILSYFTTFQVDTLFISALLSIMGYSVNDTIVIFDRIRDNLHQEGSSKDFGELAERSLQQTLTRTFNTGIGALIMLFALFFLGSESIRWFILTLIIGTVIGTYSSFFVATPLLVYWRKK